MGGKDIFLQDRCLFGTVLEAELMIPKVFQKQVRWRAQRVLRPTGDLLIFFFAFPYDASIPFAKKSLRFGYFEDLLKGFNCVAQNEYDTLPYIHIWGHG